MSYRNGYCRHGHPTIERPVQTPEGAPLRNDQGEPMTATVGTSACRHCADTILSGPHVLYPFVPPKPEAAAE